MAKPRTAKQKAALRKAQLASARKRRKSGGKSKSAPKKRGSSRAQKATYAAVAAYGAYVAYSSYRGIRSDIKKGRQQRYAILREGARERIKIRQEAKYYTHLNKIKYGWSRKVKSTRGPSVSFHTPKALTR